MWESFFGRVTLPDSMSELVCLQELSLHGVTPAGGIPRSCFSPAIALRRLTLLSQGLEGLPDSFTTLQRLESLNLHVVCFDRMPDLSPLSTLTSLVVHNTKDLDIRPLFSDLPWLKVLKVRGNVSLKR